MTPIALDALAEFLHDFENPYYKWKDYPSEYERNHWRGRAEKLIDFIIVSPAGILSYIDKLLELSLEDSINE